MLHILYAILKEKVLNEQKLQFNLFKCHLEKPAVGERTSERTVFAYTVKKKIKKKSVNLVCCG